MTIKIPAKAKIVLFIAGIILTFLSIFVFLFFYNPPKELRAYFLDVGQGDSILIRSPYGQNILIDGGPDKSILKELGKILPWWDRRVDLMVLTHPHDDQTS